MSEEKSWKTWKTRWKFTEKTAIEIVKEIFRLEGTQLIYKADIEGFVSSYEFEEGLAFAIEMGWLKDHFTGSYNVTCSGLLMLAHRIKD